MVRSRRPTVASAVVVVAGLALAGCGDDGTPAIEVVGTPQAAAPVAGSSQVSLTLANTGDGDDTLVDASTGSALATELHASEIADGRASMDVLDEIALPAGEEIRFRPGSTHLMLVVPDATVTTGGTLELVLEFARSESVTVEVEVVDLLDLAESAFDENTPG